MSAVRQMILEAVASTDDDLMERFFNDEEFTQEEILTALRVGIMAGILFRCFAALPPMVWVLVS